MRNSNSLLFLLRSKIKKNALIALGFTTIYITYMILSSLKGVTMDELATSGIVMPIFYFRGFVLWIGISVAEAVFCYFKGLWQYNRKA